MKNLLFFLLVLPLLAGGKNKVSYDKFDWKVYQSEHFNVFHYEAEAHLLPGVVDMAEAAYIHNSEKLQHQINFKIPLVIYKTHEEFEQTNIFQGFVPTYVGAFADPFQSRMVLPIDLPPKELYELLAHELAHIFQYDMLFNNKISTIIRANAPTWFIEGMASYVADDEDNLGRMVLRDAAVNAGFNSLANLNARSYMAYRVGHAAFDFMEEEWGIEGVRNFLWEYRKNITGGVEDALSSAFDLPPQEFNRKFKKYLRKRYIDLLPEKEEPDDHAYEIRTQKVFTTLSPELSPSGDLFAAVVPVRNELDLVLISTKDGRIFKNLTKGYTNRYTEINVSAFEGVNDLSWSKDGNEIAFSVRKEGTNRILVLNILTGDILEDLKFDGIRGIQSPSFGDTSDTIYFSGNREGHEDIFQYKRSSKSLVNLTDDAFVDRNPRISPNGKELIYSSIRNDFFKIVAYDLMTDQKTQLTSGLGNDIQGSFSQDMQKIFFSSDRYDDIYNIYSLDLNTGEMSQFTDVLTGAFAPQERILFDHKEGVETKQLIFTAYYEGRYRIYKMEKPDDRQEAYMASNDNFANVKEHKMSANHEMNIDSFDEYRPLKNFSIGGVDLTAGVTDDGRFLTNSRIIFSDVLNNHNLTVSAYSVSSYESYYANYLNRSNRLQWGIAFDSTQAYLVDRYVNPGDRVDRFYKNMTLGGYLRYPFSLFSRIDFNAGFADVEEYLPEPVNHPEFGLIGFDYQLQDYSAGYVGFAFSRDSLRYSSMGPNQGSSFDLVFTEMFGKRRTALLDLRNFKEISRRTMFASRIQAAYSGGDFPQIFYLGGTNNLRGDYAYREFAGNNTVLGQFEFRFPFIDAIAFPGFVIGNVRGALYTEIGGIWFDFDGNGDNPGFDQDFNWEFEDSDTYNPDNPNPNYLLGTYGFDMSMYMFGLELHWTWARRTNFEEFPTDSRYSFWIGRTF